MRKLALVSVALVLSACSFESDTPLFASNEGVLPFADGTRVQVDDETYRLQRSSGGYRLHINDSIWPARVVPIGQITQSNFRDDLVVQMGPVEGTYMYAFVLSTPTGWRVVSSPRAFRRELASGVACPEMTDEAGVSCPFESRADLIQTYQLLFGRAPASARASYGSAATVREPARPAPPPRVASGSPGDAALLDNIVAQDSYGWLLNRYVNGSMRIVSAEPQPAQDGLPPGRVVRGEYRYASGRTGWVEVYFAGGDLISLRYHNYPNTWRLPDTRASVEARRARNQAEPARRYCNDPWGEHCTN